MSLSHQDIKQDIKRVLGVGAFRATRRAKLVIWLFVLVTLILSLGVIFKIWPRVNIVIKPQVFSWQGQMEVKVDLAIKSPSYATLVIPGRFMKLGEDINNLTLNGQAVRFINGRTVIFSLADLKVLANYYLSTQLPGEAVILPYSLVINEEKWSTLSNEQLYAGDLALSVSYYYQLPLATWRQELVGLEISKVREILSKKPGVSFVNIEYYPKFLANFRQKLSNKEDDIIFTLDID